MAEKLYLVIWETEIYAASPRNAAEKALATQRDQNSNATFFGVREYDTAHGSEISIDLLDGTNDHA